MEKGMTEEPQSFSDNTSERIQVLSLVHWNTTAWLDIFSWDLDTLKPSSKPSVTGNVSNDFPWVTFMGWKQPWHFYYYYRVRHFRAKPLLCYGMGWQHMACGPGATGCSPWNQKELGLGIRKLYCSWAARTCACTDTTSLHPLMQHRCSFQKMGNWVGARQLSAVPVVQPGAGEWVEVTTMWTPPARSCTVQPGNKWLERTSASSMGSVPSCQALA